MNIVLAEIGADGAQTSERSFAQSTILIGRDSSDCDIIFEQRRFPMVSRRHAELRWHDEQWFVVDLGSSYGTYIDDVRITQPVPAAAGAAIRIGTDGPVLRVVWFESELGAADLRPAALAGEAASTASHAESSVSPRASGEADVALLEFGDLSRPPVAITKNTIWIGREADCDIVFDASSAFVSRRHASIRNVDGKFFVEDNRSFNGTLVNERRIASAVLLSAGDEVRFGMGGPILRFRHSSTVNSPVAAEPTPRSAVDASATVVLQFDKISNKRLGKDGVPQFLMSADFSGGRELIVGRDAACDIRLDGLQVSKRHARLISAANGVVAEDLNSTNGIFVNGERISRKSLGSGEALRIGPFFLSVGEAGKVDVFDTRSTTGVKVVDLTYEVAEPSTGGKQKLLDRVSMSIAPNEFVGVIGPSGAGKSTLINALCGLTPAARGSVLFGDVDLYRGFDSVKKQIGRVPQDDIVHPELSVYDTLFYTGKLRLSADVSAAEIENLIGEILDVSGLADRKTIAVNRLSGGQRKRVSIAVELLAKPAVIYLDEPTSGLDPASAERMMRLFREIAAGSTVVMTTHAAEQLRHFDKIAVLVSGKLVFYGPPGDALEHFAAADFARLYDRLERPAGDGTTNTSDRGAELEKKFHASDYYVQNVSEPLAAVRERRGESGRQSRRLGIAAAFRQWATLSRRYFSVLFADKVNVLILFAQAPVIALLTSVAVDRTSPRDFVYFVIALAAFWFGISVSAREIVRERSVYRRERTFNLGIVPYLFSKLAVLGVIAALQCILLFVSLKFLDVAGIAAMPGEAFGLPQLLTMILTASVGVACGLLVSVLVRTPEAATSIVPLILIPQILFSGIAGVPQGINRVIGLTMPSAWSFDTMKRFSTLDTLEPEGALPRGSTKGAGLYRAVETANEKKLDDIKSDLDSLKMKGTTEIPVGSLPEIPAIEKLPADLSGYVSFLHPWMGDVLNQAILMLMLGLISAAALVALRLRDHMP